MKVCVTSSGNNLDAQLDPRFGRCAYLVIVDSGNMQFEAFPNSAFGARGGAGIQAAQTIANKGAKVLITGNVGPNAFQALSAAGIDIITGASGTVREAVEKFRKGEFKKTRAHSWRPFWCRQRKGLEMKAQIAPLLRIQINNSEQVCVEQEWR